MYTYVHAWAWMGILYVHNYVLSSYKSLFLLLLGSFGTTKGDLDDSYTDIFEPFHIVYTYLMLPRINNIKESVTSVHSIKHVSVKSFRFL